MSKIKQCMITTKDNPYSPFDTDNFSLWYMYDMLHGYNSCGLLARIAHYTDDMSGPEYAAETERAIDEIIKYDFMNQYIKVTN